MRRSLAERQALAYLRVFAANKGYEVEHSTVRGCWRLIGRDGKSARAPNGTKAFTVAEAKTFLVTLPDV